MYSRFLRCVSLSAAAAFASLFAFGAPAAPAAQEAKDRVDPLSVPSGTPKELFDFIDRIKKLPPPADDLPSIVAHLKKVHAAAVSAAEKVGADATEAEQTRAINEKLNSLHLLRRLEAEGADARMKAYLEALLADKRPFVPPLAKIYYLATRLHELDHGDHAQVEKLLADVREHVRSAKPDARNLSIAFQTAMAAEQAGLVKQAAEAYVEFAAAFALSDDPQVVENSKKLAGAARMLSLVGGAIDVQGKTLDGRTLDWTKYRGKVVLVDFWATWCGPCVAELPTLHECYATYHDRGFEIVGVSLDDDKSRLTSFIDREEIPWPVLFSDDPKAGGWNHPLAVYYGVMALPRAILVDRQGKVVSLTAHGEELWDLLARQIGPPEVKPPAEKKPPDGKTDGAERKPDDGRTRTAPSPAN